MSDWYQIENSSFIIQVTSLGAEMKRLFSKDWHRELLWLGDEKTWKRTAPILFPIVGGLKNGQYSYQNKDYKLPQHGFARDTEFKCTECGTTEVSFLLEANQETFKDYPFCFSLRVQYKLDADKLTITYYVKNDDRQDIYFSIGAHPAFETKNISDYEIKFHKEEKEYFQLTNGLVDWKKPISFKAVTIKPTKELFQNDALIFKKLNSSYVDLIDHKRSEVIRVTSHTPYFGIWGKDHLPFMCLEPWHGVADEVAHDGQLQTKKGMIKLKVGEEFGFTYSIETRFAEKS